MIGDLVMSFVICVCGDHFSVTMSDGRMIMLPDHSIASETIKKEIKINNNVVLGVTGDPTPMEIAINNLRHYSYETLHVPEIRELLIAKLKTLVPNHLGVRAIISGKDKNGRFLIDVIDSKQNYVSLPIFPEYGKIAYSYAGNNELLCKTIVHMYLENTKFKNIDDIETAMKKCIIEVARYDATVNTYIFKEVIR